MLIRPQIYKHTRAANTSLVCPKDQEPSRPSWIGQRHQLSKKIFDKVRHITNKNEGNWLAYNRVHEHYGTVIQSSARSKLKGIREYYPPTAPDTYFIVYIKRDELKRIYADEAADLRQEINDILHKAQSYRKCWRSIRRSQGLSEHVPTVRNVERGRAHSTRGRVYNAPKGHSPKLTDAAAGIAKADLMMSHGEVIAKVSKIAPQTIININDLARVTAYQFQQQSSDLGNEGKDRGTHL